MVEINKLVMSMNKGSKDASRRESNIDSLYF